MAAQVIEVGGRPASHSGALRRRRAAGPRSLPDVARLVAVIVLTLLGLFGLAGAAGLAGSCPPPPEGPAPALGM